MKKYFNALVNKYHNMDNGRWIKNIYRSYKQGSN